VEAIVEDAERGELIVSPMWGEHSDWYRNVVAGGLIEARLCEAKRLKWRKLSEAERRQALYMYRRDNPLYSRAILRMLVRLHGLAGDPAEAVTRDLPMLALRPPSDGKYQKSPPDKPDSSVSRHLTHASDARRLDLVRCEHAATSAGAAAMSHRRPGPGAGRPRRAPAARARRRTGGRGSPAASSGS
jgi:hypothetical protein